MKQSDLYDYLQTLVPTIQFVDPYIDEAPLPPVGTNFATMAVLSINDRGWSQGRQTAYDATKGTTTVKYDVQRIYSVQFDFYGPDAFENAALYKQTLQVNLTQQGTVVDLKSMSEIRNLTYLEENRKYVHRYEFDVEVFVVDTIEQTEPVVEVAKITIVNRGI